MKAIEIKMPVTSYTRSAAAVANLQSLGWAKPYASVETFERGVMVRESLVTRTVIEWACKLVEETQIIYIQGTLNPQTSQRLNELKERGVIDSYKIVNLK